MGALEYEPAMQISSSSTKMIEIDQMVSVINQILNNKDKVKLSLNEQNAISQIIQIGTSAGGARPKAIIAYNPVNNLVRSGQLPAPEGFSHWIIKFDGIRQDSRHGSPMGYGKIEYAYYNMVRDSGIEMHECKLLEENNLSHFLTKRFDRVNGKDKLHMISACGIAHYDFNNPSAYSYENIFRVMREMRLPYNDMEQLYKRMVFNEIAKNYDDHVKNISFLMDKTGKWSLAPAYDISFSYSPGNFWIGSHQLAINGKREGLERKDLLEVAKNVNVKKPGEIIEKICDTLTNWGKYFNQAGVDHDKSVMIGSIINKNLTLYSNKSIILNHGNKNDIKNELKVPSVDDISGITNEEEKGKKCGLSL
jgi:serine/threonine-protein kinase HipA